MIFSKDKNSDDLNYFYSKLFKETPDLIFQFSIDPFNKYTFSLISSSILQIVELSSEDFTNDNKQSIYDRIIQEDRDSFFQSLVYAKKSIGRWEPKFRVLLPIKGLRWLKISARTEALDDGSVVFYGRVSDITEIKKQELELEISEERFQFALEASTAGVWDWDLRTDKVFYSSQSLKILDLESTDVFDNPERWDKIVHPDDLAKYYSDIQKHFDNIVPFYENYHRVLTANGKYKWILDRGKVIERDLDGKPLRVIGTHTDISAQKEKELELVRTTELFEEHNRRLLNFSYIVSHNLNTHAGNIKSLLDFIEIEEDNETKKEFLEHLRTVSNDLNCTIANLSQIVDIQNNLNIKKEPLNLNDYLEKTLKVSNLYSGKKVLFKNRIPKDVVVHFNSAYLESVLQNLTTNAIKYSHTERVCLIEYDFYVENGKKVLSISDNGLGIDLDKYGDTLFGLYKTFHQHVKSRGMGLYITKNQIEAMNGSIGVESEVGKGTTFKITFEN